VPQNMIMSAVWCVYQIFFSPKKLLLDIPLVGQNPAFLGVLKRLECLLPLLVEKELWNENKTPIGNASIWY